MKNIKRHVFIMLIYAILVLNFTNASSETKPVLNIKGNGIANQITLKPSELLSLKVDMEPGSLLGSNADWWIVAKTPSGNWYSWVYPTGWINIGTDLYAISVTYQGALFALSPFEVLSASNLAEGDYDLYFGIDTNMNGILDYQSLSYSALKVTVSSTPCTLPQVLQNGVCITPLPICPLPQVLENGVCVIPPLTCTLPQVLQNGVCVTPPLTCTLPQVLENGVCVTPPLTCTLPQVLQNGVCVIPNSNPIIGNKNTLETEFNYNAHGQLSGATTKISGISISDPDGDSLTCTWTGIDHRLQGGTLPGGDYTSNISGDCYDATWDRIITWGKPSGADITLTVTDGKGGKTIKVYSFDWGAA